MAKTKVITIEGIDGSGKTVQFKALKKLLTSRGFSVELRSYPIYESFFGAEIGRYLSGQNGVQAVDIDQKSMALWFALDRAESFKGYEDGKTDYLLINRYVLSNAVYQSIRDCDLGKPDIIDWVSELEYGHFGLPRPDLNLFFDVEPKCASDNVDKKGFREYVGKSKDVYEKSTGIQQRAREKYLEYAERFDDIAVIKCTENGTMLPSAEITAEVERELVRRGLL